MLKKALIVLFVVFNFSVQAEVVTEQQLDKYVNNWNTLMPDGAYDFIPEKVDYKLLSNPDFQNKIDEAGTKLNNKLEGKTIELLGFMVPLDSKGSDIRKFLLVPEAGQCIHVPPPPLNQTLLVDTSEIPAERRDLYEPIIVSGKIAVGSQSFDIADSGYSLSNVTVKTFKFSDVEVARD
ncbi:DUF3299 domain-containing protein [Candidatus Thioglobus sp.]|uniref:DUF3299 domain-containing protein n=1 Tax=Candidatus Thioglobus sp. TaxID=2026721 RepID=UPI00261B040C|nr:DUF3299 domain-containing protein [Candidatus Thioglobus sp.]MDG2395453.1 DUF3299 domain-containing protein [Candidatus Thioglobus sp.]